MALNPTNFELVHLAQTGSVGLTACAFSNPASEATVTEWSFGKPLFLWGLLFLIPLGMILRFWILSRQKAVFSLGLSFSKIRVVFQMLMIWLGFAFLLLALAQPRYGYEEITVQQEGRDIVVVLDASRSMYAKDVSPSRMSRAHWELVELTKHLQGDRVGLVVFAGGAYPRMPLTRDYKVFLKLVKDTEPDLFRWQGSDLASAIQMAIQLFDEKGAQRAIFVVSDGEDHSQKLALQNRSR